MKCWKAALTWVFMIGSFTVEHIRWLAWCHWLAMLGIGICAFTMLITCFVPTTEEVKQGVLQRYRDGYHVHKAVDILCYLGLFAVVIDRGHYVTFFVAALAMIGDSHLRGESKKEKPKKEGDDETDNVAI